MFVLCRAGGPPLLCVYHSTRLRKPCVCPKRYRGRRIRAEELSGVTTPNVKNSTLRPTSHMCAAAKGLRALNFPCASRLVVCHVLVLFGELGHAVIGPRWLVAFGFERLFHDDGIAVKPGEFVGQCNELIVGCSDPNFVQIGHVSHHAINDGMWVIDALGGKLLHVLIDLRCKSAKFIHAHALLTLSGTLD